MQIFAKRLRCRKLFPGERLGVWVKMNSDPDIEPLTLAEIVEAYPLHDGRRVGTEDEMIREIYDAISNGFLSPRYSAADQDTVYVLGPRLR